MGILGKQEKTNKLKNKILKLFGFTLSEVLITLVIIGVIAAITVPIINAQHRKAQYASALYKTLSVINQASKKYYITYGENPQCGYWAKNPYGPSKCTERNVSGRCTGWTLSDGSPLPSDFSGNFSDCTRLWKNFYETIATAKICDKNAYSNGCIPEYKGIAEVESSKNPNKSEYEINSSIDHFFSQDNIMSGSAIVLIDGSIIFSFVKESARYFAVDVNGEKGPNRWGYDVYSIIPKIENRFDSPVFYINDAITEKGGISAKDVLYKH